ncbi:MAG: RNA polymerase sigma factor [Deltaproteobacteria bacterium]|nr:RNA polymerase sigma factor [Deltaproteobacteria bacterium]
MARTSVAETFAQEPARRLRKNVEADPEAEKVVEVAEVDALASAGGGAPHGREGGRASAPLPEQSDQELLQGIRAQSEPHFAELYRRYFQRIYNFVYARMRNHAETEEVVQETFLAVFRSFENYRGQSSLLSWIYGIAKNTTNNSLRRSRSQSDRLDLADDDDLLPRSSVGEGSPEEQLDLHRYREQLSDRLDKLADWQTQIFEMRHLENLSIPEISERTSRSSDAVRSSLYRVKRIFYEAAQNAAANAGGGRP